MRIPWLRRGGDDGSLRVPLVIAGVLAGLVVLGGAGAAVMSVVENRRMDPTARMGPAKNYAALPPMSFAMSGARSMDLKVRVELDPAVDPGMTEPYATRIADRLGDRVRLIEPERLQGAEGARLLKSTIMSVIDREIRPLKVRDVLLESMIIR
ncbi:flagellar basal body-associated FliL family protein [Azospirillum halopraeferens]|uniref:flagellar basal body-associated FliL family protein n=1 Tax=Azospirillum halopraeferens TaxID=34010 RepID=UPI0006873CD5|nr:flagellar basal body-associated FliL family protein [Azospirillum halopraeferens]